MNKRIKVSSVILTLISVCGFVLILCGCTHRIAGNYPNYGYIKSIESDNGFLIPNYEINVKEKKYAEIKNDESAYSVNFLYGGTAPRYSIVTPTGFDGVKPHIEALPLGGRSVADANGYITDGKLVGFANVYKDTIGYLSGGGNYGVEEISRGILFEYLPETDTFTETKRFDGCNVVAYNGTTVLYWRDRNYYSYDLNSQTESFLVEDKAYDKGIQHQSYTNIFTNTEYTAIFITKSKFSKETRFAYLYDYTTKEFCQLTQA